MHVLIDSQVTVEVTAYILVGEDGEDQLVDTAGTLAILSAWEKLAPGRRGIRYGRDDGDTEPATIYVAEASSNKLDLFDLSPFWDGVGTRSAYRLADLEDTLPVKVVD